ncbi:MAG TPA: hypothetical protein VGN63_16905 [Flavisolibacter sp.]|jgi:hypothetical protein|nr:hypothetical protein [Flavisolibacter sp.]
MKKSFLFILVSLLVHCSPESEKATLYIGNSITFTANGEFTVSGTTNFTKGDTIAFVLSQQTPFDFPFLTYILYKIEKGQQQKLKVEHIKINPGVRFVRNKFPAGELIRQYGFGDFLVQFYGGKSLVAEKIYKLSSQ